MTGATTQSHVADSIKTIPRPDEPIPAVAVPTLVLFVLALATWCASAALGTAGLWPAPISVVVSGVAAFLLFTVAHECSHASASSIHGINLWMGRIATPFFTVVGGFSMLRFIHMQHHRFTNHSDGRDPDHYTQSKNRFALPLRWATVDLAYTRFYFPKLSQRPRTEKIEFVVNEAILIGVIAALCIQGFAMEVLLYYFLPTRIALFILACTFDWLPHHELPDDIDSNKYRATRVTIGAEWLLTPLLLYQNYHLVHHLHPRIPFYRYIKVWRRNEAAYLSHDPAMSSPLGRPVTQAEYRRLRHLEEHH
ncbi:MAG: fatty acid desaturase [Solirubrobacterales bacterium]